MDQSGYLPLVDYHLDAAMHGTYYIQPVYQVHVTAYVLNYAFQHRSRGNYWPGYERIV